VSTFWTTAGLRSGTLSSVSVSWLRLQCPTSADDGVALLESFLSKFVQHSRVVGAVDPGVLKIAQAKLDKMGEIPEGVDQWDEASHRSMGEEDSDFADEDSDASGLAPSTDAVVAKLPRSTHSMTLRTRALTVADEGAPGTPKSDGGFARAPAETPMKAAETGHDWHPIVDPGLEAGKMRMAPGSVRAKKKGPKCKPMRQHPFGNNNPCVLHPGKIASTVDDYNLDPSERSLCALLQQLVCSTIWNSLCETASVSEHSIQSLLQVAMQFLANALFPKEVDVADITRSPLMWLYEDSILYRGYGDLGLRMSCTAFSTLAVLAELKVEVHGGVQLGQLAAQVLHIIGRHAVGGVYEVNKIAQCATSISSGLLTNGIVALSLDYIGCNPATDKHEFLVRVAPSNGAFYMYAHRMRHALEMCKQVHESSDGADLGGVTNDDEADDGDDADGDDADGDDADGDDADDADGDDGDDADGDEANDADDADGKGADGEEADKTTDGEVDDFGEVHNANPVEVLDGKGRVTHSHVGTRPRLQNVTNTDSVRSSKGGTVLLAPAARSYVYKANAAIHRWIADVPPQPNCE
jgi:hypothetical protein